MFFASQEFVFFVEFSKVLIEQNSNELVLLFLNYSDLNLLQCSNLRNKYREVLLHLFNEICKYHYLIVRFGSWDYYSLSWVKKVIMAFNWFQLVEVYLNYFCFSGCRQFKLNYQSAFLLVVFIFKHYFHLFSQKNQRFG